MQLQCDISLPHYVMLVCFNKKRVYHTKFAASRKLFLAVIEPPHISKTSFTHQGVIKMNCDSVKFSGKKKMLNIFFARV